MPSAVNGFSVAYTVAGGIILWSGIRGSSISDTFRSVLAGSTSPAVTEQIAGAQPGGESTPGSNAGVSSLPGDTGAHGATAAANQATGKRIAAGFGWSTGPQWDALVALWNGESGWNNTAQNPGSTAYGIAQFLDTTWSSVGASKTSDPAAQIFAGLTYIKVRYGNPANAYKAWLSRNPHWY